MTMRTIYQLFLILILLTSCAGYKLKSKSNPFASLNIKTIAVPVFINKTSLDKISHQYATSVIEVLSEYSDLSVTAGNIVNEDAVVIGIIKSNKAGERGSFIKTHSLMTEEQKEAIGNRNAFDVPTAGEFNIIVDVVILKRPSKEEIAFFTSELGRKVSTFPNMIFSQSINVTKTFTIENPVGDQNSGAPVRGVQNKGKLRKSLSDSAKDFKSNFKEMISNAY